MERPSSSACHGRQTVILTHVNLKLVIVPLGSKDMLDGTPILDIKPYLSSIPADTPRREWLAEAEARKE
jgi:tRNA (Thr-GGU) A37 N-methylase